MYPALQTQPRFRSGKGETAYQTERHPRSFASTWSDTCIPPPLLPPLSRVIYLMISFVCRWLSERAPGVWFFLFCFLLQDITTTTTASSVTGLSILYQTSSWLGPSGAGILFAFTAGQVDHRRLVFPFLSLSLPFLLSTRGNAAMHQPTTRQEVRGRNLCGLCIPLFSLVLFYFPVEKRHKEAFLERYPHFLCEAGFPHTGAGDALASSIFILSPFQPRFYFFTVLRMMFYDPFYDGYTPRPKPAGTTTLLGK